MADGWAEDWAEAMRRGAWTQAHAMEDDALARRDPATRDDPSRPYHERWVWDGTPPDGRAVLVRCYHGLGDTVQFARFLPGLAARAARLTVEAQPALIPLLRGLPGGIAWHGFDPAHPLPPAPCTAEIMELGHVFRATPETLPPCPYLLPTTGAQAGIDPGQGSGWGLCWRGGDWDETRSVPLAALLAAVRHRSGAAPLVGLIPGERHPGLDRTLPPGISVEETAAVISGLGRVVTVDTMIAHLTGALGVRGTVILRPAADWRWNKGTRSLWYPSLGLARPAHPDHWPPSLPARL